MKFINELGMKTTRKPMTANAMQKVGRYNLTPYFNCLGFKRKNKAKRMAANSQRKVLVRCAAICSKPSPPMVELIMMVMTMATSNEMNLLWSFSNSFNGLK